MLKNKVYIQWHLIISKRAEEFMWLVVCGSNSTARVPLAHKWDSCIQINISPSNIVNLCSIPKLFYDYHRVSVTTDLGHS